MLQRKLPLYPGLHFITTIRNKYKEDILKDTPLKGLPDTFVEYIRTRSKSHKVSHVPTLVTIDAR